MPSPNAFPNQTISMADTAISMLSLPASTIGSQDNTPGNVPEHKFSLFGEYAFVGDFEGFRIHSFTGVFGGLFLFVICWSGTFAVIAHELDWLASPERRVEPPETRASWGEIQSAVQTAYPDAPIRAIYAPDQARAAARVYILSRNEEWIWVHVDPYSGDVLGRGFMKMNGKFYEGPIDEAH